MDKIRQAIKHLQTAIAQEGDAEKRKVLKILLQKERGKLLQTMPLGSIESCPSGESLRRDL